LDPWERTISRFFHVFRLDSIKRKIMVFALLATLIPSLTMGWLSYVNNKRFLQGKITQELSNVTSHTARELDLWLKERSYEVRVFSTSYEVSENLVKILRSRGGPTGAAQPRHRLKDYLKSVRGKFTDIEELMVIDPKGRMVATSSENAGAAKIPTDWINQVKKGEVILGDAYWEKALKRTVMMIPQPIRAADGRFLGLFAAKLNFRAIDGILKGFSLGKTGEVYLMTRNGALIIGSRSASMSFMKTKLAARTTHDLLKKEAISLEYNNYLGKRVVGTLRRVPRSDWAVVAEIRKDEAFAQIDRLRNLTLLMVSGLLLVIGLTAYILGLTIIRPLDRLTNGAAKVGDGNLDVDLPVVNRGEVGYMTEVFNYMVGRLRKGREELAAINQALIDKNKELEELSVTDGLTGLYNRKHLMERLTQEMTRARRYNRPFSVLMIDIDHFKKYNDTFGHLAGDEVLVRIASVFKKSIRAVDYAARYGGEEFLVMLPETGLEDALEATERIRTLVAEETFGRGNQEVHVTLSIGVAEFPENGDTSESLIATADAALYEAKQGGRNRVVRANGRQAKKPLSTSSKVAGQANG
jgi:diguanylate cyclase (GGDEF)-like protein